MVRKDNFEIDYRNSHLKYNKDKNKPMLDKFSN